MKAFIYPADGYVGRSLGPLLVKQGYEVLGGTNQQVAPDYVSTSFQISSDWDGSAARQLLLASDLVVYHTPGHEPAARSAIVLLSQQLNAGRQQTFICISTPLAWATTRPPVVEPWSGGMSGVVVQDPAVAAAAAAIAAAAAAAIATAASDADSEGGAAPPSEDGKDDDETPPAAEKSPLTASFVSSPVVVVAVPFVPPVGLLTDKDVHRRTCGAAGRDALELEHLVLRGARKGRLATYVICPGLMYGCGEDDDLLHPLFMRAWHGKEALTVYGPGTNRLPMIHITDLVAYVAAVASCQPEQQYFLAADRGGSTQSQVVSAISAVLGSGDVKVIPKQEMLSVSANDQLLLDLQFAASPLPASANYTQLFGSGLVDNLAAVSQQYLTVRGIAPLRIVLAGSPMAGKTALGARLSRLYGLPHLLVKELLDSAANADPELAKNLAAELVAKEPRATNRTLAALLRIMTEKSSNRGYILDGWPRNLAQGKHCFMKLEPMTAEEVLQAEKEAAIVAAVSPAAPGRGKKDNEAKKATAKSAALTGVASEEPVVPPGHQLVPDRAVFPTHLFMLQSDDAALKARLVAVGILEVEAAKAAAAAAIAAGAAPTKGGGRAAAADAVKTHNNDKDFVRRMETYHAMQHEDEEDLLKKIALVQLLWQVSQREAAEVAARELAEANTLKAKRRRAKALAAGGELGSAEVPIIVAPAQPVADLMAQYRPRNDTDSPSPEPGEPRPPPGPALPLYGGLCGLLAEHGAIITALPNPQNAVHSDNVFVAAEAEAVVRNLIGVPHNFEGFPPDVPPRPPSPPRVVRPVSVDRGPKQAEHAAATPESQSVWEAAQADYNKAHAQQRGHVGAPLRSFLMRDVMAPVTDALISIARDRPLDPLQFLADALLAEATRVDELYVDPYTHESYEIQAQKLVAKAEREAARRAFAEAKLEREAVARAEQQALRRDLEEPLKSARLTETG